MAPDRTGVCAEDVIANTRQGGGSENAKNRQIYRWDNVRYDLVTLR